MKEDPSTCPAEYVAAAEVRALLADSQSIRQQRLDAADMISAEEAAHLMGVPRITIDAWITKGRAIGMARTDGHVRCPRWQFETLMWKSLSQLSVALGVAEGWALLSFLESPHGALQGMTPRQAIEQGQEDKVIRIATHEGI